MLELGPNFFYGVIPREIGKLANLESLDLSSNSLTGIIPPELGNLGRLRIPSPAISPKKSEFSRTSPTSSSESTVSPACFRQKSETFRNYRISSPLLA
ncbi:hypothetical protein L2E82_28331 [Cichorium intybus]|uniref:Uncharacterized protein n=1 Tax=Cichorium intybus TaxID=13427 RepID=A0ACB9CVP8_CICIN|nr:hypothetical protein L2E82_28331 [Cichorium intybus]